MMRALLIDGSAVAYQTLYGAPKLRRRDDVAVGAPVLFITRLSKYIAHVRPTHVAIAFDVGRNFRYDLADGYKANRGARDFDEDQLAMWDMMMHIARALPMIEGGYYEADDILCALASHLVRHDRIVYASDVYRWRPELRVVQDFLKSPRVPDAECDVVTNPPFYWARDFAVQGMRVSPTGRVWLLVKLAFLQGGARHESLFKRLPPRYVYVFVRRLPRMHMFGYEGPMMKSGAIPMAWLMFERGFVGEPRVRWLP